VRPRCDATAAAVRDASIFELPTATAPVPQTPPTRGQDLEAASSAPRSFTSAKFAAAFDTAIKELMHEEFGDDIMSAIDFRLTVKAARIPRATGSNS
jgi:cyanate lyase